MYDERMGARMRWILLTFALVGCSESVAPYRVTEVTRTLADAVTRPAPDAGSTRDAPTVPVTTTTAHPDAGLVAASDSGLMPVTPAPVDAGSMPAGRDGCDLVTDDGCPDSQWMTCRRSMTEREIGGTAFRVREGPAECVPVVGTGHHWGPPSAPYCMSDGVDICGDELSCIGPACVHYCRSDADCPLTFAGDLALCTGSLPQTGDRYCEPHYHR